MVEVRIPCVEREVMLEHEGGDPHVVHWNRRALPAELPVGRGVVMRGGFVREQRMHAGTTQEPGERPLVLGAAASEAESSAKLGEDDEWNEDLGRMLD
jgi:hypothetical protein